MDDTKSTEATTQPTEIDPPGLVRAPVRRGDYERARRRRNRPLPGQQR